MTVAKTAFEKIWQSPGMTLMIICKTAGHSVIIDVTEDKSSWLNSQMYGIMPTSLIHPNPAKLIGRSMTQMKS